jgi:hypothetical protein
MRLRESQPLGGGGLAGVGVVGGGFGQVKTMVQAVPLAPSSGGGLALERVGLAL